MALLAAYGYWGLFVASFLAATILPFSSEIILATMLAKDFDPELTLFSASLGNILGAVVNYGLGMAGSRLVREKIFRTSDRETGKAVERLKRYGTFSLLFAWVPVIGDPLTVAAGVLKVNFWFFLLLVGSGKFLRYLALVLLWEWV